MPITRSAIKKQKQDKKREKANELFEKKLKSAIKKAKKSKNENSVKEAISLIDKAVKKNIFHKNKAARLKSELSKLSKITGGKSEKKAEVKKPAKKTSAKTTQKA